MSTPDHAPSAWFPRPSAPEDLRLLGASGELGRDEIYALLHDAEAHEWRERVGVSSPADGSGKASTRLLKVRGWVFKTDTLQAEAERAGPQERLADYLRLVNRVELWHPDKRWFLLRTHDPELGERWWPVSVCPELETLRGLADWAALRQPWAKVIGRSLELSNRHGVGLDLGPANFGFEAEAGPRAPVWYLDDETYPALELADIAQAVVNRIPEHEAVEAGAWRAYARELRGQLEPSIVGPWQWRELLLQLQDVALAPRWQPRRAALVRGLRDVSEMRRRAAPRREQPRLTAVIADVHANLPALEAVINAAESAGVDSWLFLGDAVGYGPHVEACVRRLAELPNFLGVRGNHDHMVCFGGEEEANRLARSSLRYAREQLGDRSSGWLMSLPVELLREDWMAVHGAPVDPRRFMAYVYQLSFRANLEHLAAGPRRLCFHGHTHVPMIYRLAEAEGSEPESITVDEGFEFELEGARAVLVNPGSIGQPRDGDTRSSFVLWDRVADRLRFRRVRYPVLSTIAAVHDAGLPEDLAARLEIGR